MLTLSTSALLTLAIGSEGSDTTGDCFQHAVLAQVAYLKSELASGREAGMASSWNKSLADGSGDRPLRGASFFSRTFIGPL